MPNHPYPLGRPLSRLGSSVLALASRFASPVHPPAPGLDGGGGVGRRLRGRGSTAASSPDPRRTSSESCHWALESTLSAELTALVTTNDPP